MIEYTKYFDSNKAMSFKVIDKKLLKKYTEIWGKISSSIGKEFDSEPVDGDNDIYIKTKIKSHGDKVNTNFQGKEIPKESASYKSINQSNNQSIISQSINQSINNISSDFKTQEIRLQLQKASNLQSKILV